MSACTHDQASAPGVVATAHPLHSLFSPRGIALVGATARTIWMSFIARNIIDFRFAGQVHAVNRGGVDVLGFKGYRSCRDIGSPVDVAFIFLPQAAVIEALDDAAGGGIRNCVILTSGYAEIGDEGRIRQAELLARVEALGMRMWGPNSLGFNNIGGCASVSAIPAALPLLPPQIAIVAQSGALASELHEFAQSQNIGASFVAATGNEAQLTLADVVDYLVDHEETRAIAIFAEAIRDPARFSAAAMRARACAKPIVVLKIGRSALAAEVANAHTGSLAGDDSMFSAVCEHLGIIRVHSAEDLILTAGLLAVTGPLARPGFAFVSISGGACTLVADGAEAAGVEVPAFPAETVDQLRPLVADIASTLNPLDVTGAAMTDPGLLERLIPVAASANNIGLVGVNFAVPVSETALAVDAALAAIGRAVAHIDKPAIIVTATAKSLTDLTRRAIAEHGLPPIFCGIDAMLRAIGRAAWWSTKLGDTAPAITFAAASAPAQCRPGTEREVLDYLAEHGVPVIPATVARSAAQAAEQAAAIGRPLVMKVLSPDIPHKTEVGGVRLGVDPAVAGATWSSIMDAVTSARADARVEGVILSPMRSAGGVELLVGVTRDPSWGLMLAVGIGGVLVEILKDVVITPLPVDRRTVLHMLARLKGARLLCGFRGVAPVDLEALAEAIARIASAAQALGPRLRTLEVNPLLASGASVEALDGLVEWLAEEWHV